MGFNVQRISDQRDTLKAIFGNSIKIFLYQRCARFKLDIFFSPGKLSISRFSCSDIFNLIVSTWNEKKANHLSTPFCVDFWSLPQGFQETPAHWFKYMQKVQNNKTIENNIYRFEATQIKIEESSNFPLPQSRFLRTIDLLFLKQVFRSIFSDYHLFIK